MKTSISIDSGNFTLSVSGEVSEEKLADLVMKGLKYETERSVLSKVYLDLAGVPGVRGNSKVLPKAFERKSVEFSNESAEKFKGSAQSNLEDFGQFEVSVTRYVSEESTSTVQAQKLYLAAKSKGSLQALADHESIGYEGDVNDEEEFVKWIHQVKYAKKAPQDELKAMGF